MSIEVFSSRKQSVVTRTVYAHNLVAELGHISSSVDLYPFVTIDTEFSGFTSSPVTIYDGFRHRNPSNLYNLLKSNGGDFKLIQVGLTLADADGNLPDLGTQNHYVWEFNFKDFDPSSDPHSAEWIQTLKQKGIDFQKNLDHGIDPVKFAELMMSSGLVCNEEMTWVTFHGAHDFGYLLKMLTGRALPDDLPQFMDLSKTFFGTNVYDVKHMMGYFEGLHGGLEQVAKTLKVEPADGTNHQAGGNSLLTWKIYLKMKDICGGEMEVFGGAIFGFQPYR